MSEGITAGFCVGMFVGAFFTFTIGGLHVSSNYVRISSLRDSGYEVVRHEERHGTSCTNWIEVVKTKEGR